MECGIEPAGCGGAQRGLANKERWRKSPRGLVLSGFSGCVMALRGNLSWMLSWTRGPLVERRLVNDAIMFWLQPTTSFCPTAPFWKRLKAAEFTTGKAKAALKMVGINTRKMLKILKRKQGVVWDLNAKWKWSKTKQSKLAMAFYGNGMQPLVAFAID